MKRLGVFADLHCGHRAGLTHPNWFVSAGTDKNKRILQFQQEMWRRFSTEIKQVKKEGSLDAALWNGDLIDGRGERSGGVELVINDRQEQCECAARIIKFVGAPQNFITRGTRYHTGWTEDWENAVARLVNDNKAGQEANIKNHHFLNLAGLLIGAKHKIGSSSIPHGRLTPIEREKFWNLIWSQREADGQPRCGVTVRSHVHYSNYTRTELGVGITTPALQAAWTEYGARECAGTVDFGFWVIDAKSRKDFTCSEHLIPLKSVKCEVIVI